MKKRIMFYCQPVLGLGHLVRSLAILRGLADFEVWFVNGGWALDEETSRLVPAEIRIIDLPPLQSDPEFREIESPDPAGDLTAIRAERQRILIETLGRVEPAILLIELYPFGRLKFDFEIRPLLEAARRSDSPPRIVCSLRDILVAKRDQAGFEEFAITTANRFFDLILVHSDPIFQPLDETFPAVGRLTCRVEYTGYVVPAIDSSAVSAEMLQTGESTIIVSIGGGRVGLDLLRDAVAASRLLQPTHPHRLRVFTGPYLPEDDFRSLRKSCEGVAQIEISRFTPDLVGEMRGAALSISMAGYNTCMDILTAGIPAIVHPFTGNNNREQTLRAHKLEAAGFVRVINDEELTPENLAQMIASMLEQPLESRPLEIDREGVKRTSLLLHEVTNRDPLNNGRGK